jgi:hypothetical protein
VLISSAEQEEGLRAGTRRATELLLAEFQEKQREPVKTKQADVVELQMEDNEASAGPGCVPAAGRLRVLNQRGKRTPIAAKTKNAERD